VQLLDCDVEESDDHIFMKPVIARIPFDNVVTEAMINGLPLVEYVSNGVSQQMEILWETASKMVEKEKYGAI